MFICSLTASASAAVRVTEFLLCPNIEPKNPKIESNLSEPSDYLPLIAHLLTARCASRGMTRFSGQE
jgi:hypothetical protein